MTPDSHWTSTRVGRHDTLSDVIQILDRNPYKICLVVDDDFHLFGTITDGDIRRAILRSVAMDSPAEMIMRSTPVTGHINDDEGAWSTIMRNHHIRQLPLVDDHGIVRNLVTEEGAKSQEWKNYPVVILAGGLGTRLSPLTDETPKPMIKVGDKPLLETIVDRFSRQGFRNLFISVNYRRGIVKDHFGDGARWNCQITYVEEDQKLGTAGPLALLPCRPKGPFIVVNGDVLTNVRFESLIDYHLGLKARATVGLREYDFQVPYGVVESDGECLTGIEEKPVRTINVNAGIYVLEPEIIDLIEPDTATDMPQVIRRALERKWKVGAFPIREYWIDIGRHGDLERANLEYSEAFE